MPGVLTEGRKHGSRTSGAVLHVLGAIALLVPSFAALFLIRGMTRLLALAAIERVICAFQPRGGEGLFLKVLPALVCAEAGGLLRSRPVGGAIPVPALIGFCERTFDQRWLDAGGGLVAAAGS